MPWGAQGPSAQRTWASTSATPAGHVPKAFSAWTSLSELHAGRGGGTALLTPPAHTPSSGHAGPGGAGCGPCTTGTSASWDGPLRPRTRRRARAAGLGGEGQLCLPAPPCGLHTAGAP